jgi:ribose transport system substrate-binding protein
MRRKISVLLFVLVTVALTECESPQGESDKLQIAVIPKGTSHVFWQSVHAGAVRAGREVDAEIIWRGPLREDDRESQISEMDRFVSRGISGIVLAPLDDVALRASVAAATGRGIPVVIIDSALRGDDYVSFVATDNFRAGQMAGDHMGKLLGERGRVILLRYSEGHASTTNREEGFLAAVRRFDGLEIVSDNQYGGTDVEGAYKKAENLLSRFVDDDAGSLLVDGIFCPNESSVFAMLRVLIDNGWAGRVRFVGFDSSDNLSRALADGHIDALVLQDPMQMGYLGVKNVVDHLRGNSVPARVDTGAVLATRENMNEPAVQALLNPDLREWLGN